MRLHRVVLSALALCLFLPLTAARAQDPEPPDTDAPGNDAPAPSAPAPALTAPALTALPPVQVRLTAFGAPSRLTIRCTGTAHAFDVATGEELPLAGTAVPVIASGNGVRVGEAQAGAVRLEAEMLTLGEGRAARSYPSRLLISAPNGRLTLVNECSLEDYTQGVLAGECPASFHPEAIKAMAIAVRSYSYRKAFIAHAELCDTTHCQVYRGLGSVRSSIREAVRATAGTVALYGTEVIDAVYCSDCGGYTEGNEDAWRGAKAVPYLRPVEDAPEPHGEPYCAVNRSHTWSLTFPLARLSGLLGRFAPTWKLAVQDLTASGRVRRLGFGPAARSSEPDRSAEAPHCGDPSGVEDAPPPAEKEEHSRSAALRSVTGEQWRRTLGLSTLKSLLFSVKLTGGAVEIDGRGWGHGVGLCQFGAHGMGLKGATCEQILKHYYTGISLGPAPMPTAASGPAAAPRRRVSRRYSLSGRHARTRS